MLGCAAAAIRRERGERDGTGEFWWVEARNLRAFPGPMRSQAGWLG